MLIGVMSHWSGVEGVRQLSRQKTIIVFLTAVIFFLSSGKSGAIDSASGMIDLARPIVHISIKGNERVHESTIRYYISLKEGDLYSPSKVRNDIKRIYDLGYFDDIKVDLEEEASGLTVTYLIKSESLC